jgi:hypothetical protein
MSGTAFRPSIENVIGLQSEWQSSRELRARLPFFNTIHTRLRKGEQEQSCQTWIYTI